MLTRRERQVIALMSLQVKVQYDSPQGLTPDTGYGIATSPARAGIHACALAHRPLLVTNGHGFFPKLSLRVPDLGAKAKFSL